MTRAEFADRLEHYAAQIHKIRGVGRNGPHAFVEDKSEITSAMMAEARGLRAVAVVPASVARVATIESGIRQVGRERREVVVTTRRRRA